LFENELEKPIHLKQAEALERRTPINHPKRKELEMKLRNLESGYQGEKTLHYFLGLLPSKKYHIFHGLRLPVGDTHFQIDALLISSKVIIILDAKNYSGKLLIEKQQLTQEYNDSKEVYDNPIAQVNRHKLLLRNFFEKYDIPVTPIEPLVVLTRSSTEVKMAPGYTEAEKKVCRVNNLLMKLEEIEKYSRHEIFDSKIMSKMKRHLLAKHEPLINDLEKVYGIKLGETMTGVRCRNCTYIPMNYYKGTWICPKCNTVSKDAYLEAVNDYFLIIKPTMTNSELRAFLHLPSPISICLYSKAAPSPIIRHQQRTHLLPTEIPHFLKMLNMFPILKQTLKKTKIGGTWMKKLSYILSISLLLFLIPNPANAAVSNQPIHWGFKKSVNEQPAEAGAMYDQLLAKYGAVYKGNPKSKILYLTFDAGYENGYTPKILDVLKKEKVPATFFVTGHFLESQPELSKRIVKEGHIIGNHSWHHPDFTQESDAKIREELEKVKIKTKELTGQKEMNYLRPPRGIFSERTLQVAKEAGYTHVLWSLAYVDWNVNQQKGWQYSYNNIMNQVHPGCVMLLHSVSKDNADALEKAIKDLKKRGYTFKSLDYLMKHK